MTRADAPDNYAAYVGEPSTTELIRGGSVIVVPFSEVIAGPLRGRESVLSSRSIWTT